MRPRTDSQRAWLAVLALTALGAALRLPVANFGLPHLSHYDEYFTLTALDALRADPEHARSTLYYNVYPHFTIWITKLLAPLPVPLVTGDLAQHLAAASRDLWIVRLVSTSLALLAVPGTWLLARCFLPTRTALLAAALVATSVFHAWYSVHAKPHGPGSALGVLTIVAAIQMRRHGSAPWYLLAGLVTGIAIGCSQACLSLLPALLCAHLLRERTGSRFAHLWFVLGLALTAVCMMAFGEAWLGTTVVTGQVLLSGDQHFSPLDIVGLVLLGLWHFDPLLSALALGSTLAWLIGSLRRRELNLRWLRGREDLAVVLAHVLPYAVAVTLNQHGSHRYLLLLWPYMMCAAAWGLLRLTDASTNRLVRALPIVLLVLETTCTLQMNRVQLGEDTDTRAAHWIEHNLDPRTTRIAVLPGLDLPLLRRNAMRPGDYEGQKATAWARYQARLGERERGATVWQIFSAPLASIAPPEADAPLPDAEYIVVALDDRKIMTRVTEHVRSIGTRVARFSPMAVDEGDDTPFLWWDAHKEYREGWSRLWRMLHARSVGAVVEIYRVQGR